TVREARQPPARLATSTQNSSPASSVVLARQGAAVLGGKVQPHHPADRDIALQRCGDTHLLPGPEIDEIIAIRSEISLAQHSAGRLVGQCLVRRVVLGGGQRDLVQPPPRTT